MVIEFLSQGDQSYFSYPPFPFHIVSRKIEIVRVRRNPNGTSESYKLTDALENQLANLHLQT